MKSNSSLPITYMALIIAAFLLAGCPGKEAEIARDNLIKAETMLEAAEMTHGDAAAPKEMSQARSDLAQAGVYYEVEPNSGRLSNNLKYNSQLKELSIANSQKAQESARTALLAANGQTTANVLNQAGEDNGQQEALDSCEGKLENFASELTGCRDEISLIRNAAAAGPATTPARSIYDELAVALQEKLGVDLRSINASIQTGSLSFRFGEYRTLFARDSAEITPAAREALEKFLPGFTEVIMSPTFKERIKEIRVEGHASSYYQNAQNDAEKYYLNLLLSQKRAANAIGVMMSNDSLLNNRWLQSRLFAVGMSSNSPVLNSDGSENHEKSRRIEFRVITTE